MLALIKREISLFLGLLNLANAHSNAIVTNETVKKRSNDVLSVVESLLFLSLSQNVILPMFCAFFFAFCAREIVSLQVMLIQAN